MGTPKKTQYRMWEPGGTESKDTSGGGLGTPPYGGHTRHPRRGPIDTKEGTKPRDGY